MRARGAVLTRSPIAPPYAGSNGLDVTTVELDQPRGGELLVRVEAAGVCHSDLSVVDGNRPRPLPMLLGHEAAGVVEATGEGVRNVRVGDHVVLVYVPSCGACRFCASGRPALCTVALAANTAGELVGGGSRITADGDPVHHHLGVSAFATHAVVDASSAVVVDRDVPLEVAALFGCAMLTGYGAVHHTAGVRVGDSVAVFGLGGVGLAAVMAAVATGAGPVVAVDPVPAKQALALEVGATRACAPDDLDEVVAEVAPERFDWAFEAVGSVRALTAAYAVTGRGGGTVAMGLPHPDAVLELPALGIVAENRRILGSYMGTARPGVDIPTMIALWRAGRLPVDRMLSAELGLDEVARAMDELAGGRAVRQVIRPHAGSVS